MLSASYIFGTCVFFLRNELLSYGIVPLVRISADENHTISILKYYFISIFYPLMHPCYEQNNYKVDLWGKTLNFNPIFYSSSLFLPSCGLFHVAIVINSKASWRFKDWSHPLWTWGCPLFQSTLLDHPVLFEPEIEAKRERRQNSVVFIQAILVV